MHEITRITRKYCLRALLVLLAALAVADRPLYISVSLPYAPFCGGQGTFCLSTEGGLDLEEGGLGVAARVRPCACPDRYYEANADGRPLAP